MRAATWRGRKYIQFTGRILDVITGQDDHWWFQTILPFVGRIPRRVALELGAAVQDVYVCGISSTQAAARTPCSRASAFTIGGHLSTSGGTPSVGMFAPTDSLLAMSAAIIACSQ